MITGSGREEGQIFSKKFLVVLLVISMLVNIILFIQLTHPGVVRNLQLAFLPAPAVVASDHIRGNPNAKYTVVEYADFQCPFCAQFHETMRAIIKEADVRWVYRHFPLPAHESARMAAEASECAAEQGKFWEYSDALFGFKGKITEETFYQVAGKQGLDVMAFGICLNTGKSKPAVAAQFEDGEKKKITGTPTFYLNGRRYVGSMPLEELRKMVGVKD